MVVSKIYVHMSLKYSCCTKILKPDLVYIELCDGYDNFMNNVYSHFVKIIYIFYDRPIDTKYITIVIFTIFGQNSDIIIIIIF
jgi:hypothetical protein